MTDERRLATIRGLLSKAEATEFPDEAEAFFAKASELISRWAIDEAMVWADADSTLREQPAELQFVVHAPYMVQKSLLVSVVARGHLCTTVRLVGGSGAKTEVVSIVGFPSDLQWVDTLTTSLMVQMTAAMLSEAPSGLRPAESASWRRSFIMGFADTVRVRLEADRKAAMAEQDRAAGTKGAASAASGPASVSLVLASRKDEVDAHTRRLHPHTRVSRASVGSSFTGRSAGRAAGRRASMGRNRLGGRRALGR